MDPLQRDEKDSPVKSDLMVNRATSGLAALYLAFPRWDDALSQASHIAGLLVPILSALWLAVQIVRVLMGKGRKE